MVREWSGGRRAPLPARSRLGFLGKPFTRVPVAFALRYIEGMSADRA